LCPLFSRGQYRQATGLIAKAVIRQLEFKRRIRFRRPSSLRLIRPLRAEISQRFRYLRDLPPASSEYSPQLTQRSRQRRAAHEKSHELLRDYWTSLLGLLTNVVQYTAYTRRFGLCNRAGSCSRCAGRIAGEHRQAAGAFAQAVIRSVELIAQPAAKDAVSEMAVRGDWPRCR